MGYLDELITESKKTGKPIAREVEEKGKAIAAGIEEKLKPQVKEKMEEELFKEGNKEAIEEIQVKGEKELVASYGDVRIYKIPGEPLLFYQIPVIKPAGPEKIILNTIKEAATRLITIAPEEIRDPSRRRNFFFKRIKEIIESSPELGVPKTKIEFYAEMVVREMIGYGILDSLTRDDNLEEIMVIGPEKPVYVFHMKYDMMKTNIMFGKDDEIVNIIDRIARQVNRRVDLQDPLLDARLPDGSRVNATVKPVSLGGATLTVRKFREDPFSVVDLIKYNTMDINLASFLWLAVDGFGVKPANILISGGTGSGKTTTLNVLASFIPKRERIVSIEDTAELNIPVEHWIRFESRPPSIEGGGEVTMDILVKNSLRMRPDRILVGEIRHTEAFTLFTAMNTGHDGCMGTVHANSAEETLIRLVNPPMNVPDLMISALNFVVVQQRIHDRRKGTIRRITEVAEIQGMENGRPQMNILFQWDAATDMIKPTGVPSKFEQEILKYTGLSREDLKFEVAKRKKFLENLLSKDIHSMPEIIKRLEEYQAQK